MKKYASSILVKGASVDNSPKLQALINATPSGNCIQFPDGDYYFKSPIIVFGKALILQGAENTNLYFSSDGIYFTPDVAIQTCAINDINIFYQEERNGTSHNGIECRTITNLRNVFIKNFGGTGLMMTGDIGTSKTNVSRSIVENVEVAECGQGFYMQGGDANGISFYSCDARDCDTYGFNDDSFLGCSFYSCMAHANKLGGYRAMNGNNRTLFMGCYNEGGQPESEVGGVTYVFGGICGFGAGWKAMSPNVKIIQQ